MDLKYMDQYLPGVKLFEDGKITNDSIRLYMDKKYKQLHDLEFIRKNSNVPSIPEEAFTFMKMERHGGDCPSCGKPWKMAIVKNRFADFSFYEPDCLCPVCSDPLGLDDVKAQRLYKNYAGIPEKEMKSKYDTWDYTVSKSITESMRESHRHLTCGDLLEKRIGLILYGAVGTGKTRCGIMLMHEIHATKPKVKMQFISMASLLSNIIHDKKGYIESLMKNDLLMLDDVDKIASENAWAQEQVFSLFDTIFRENKTLVATSNAQNIDTFSKKFSDAVASRIIGSCLFIKFDGTKNDDYRLKKGVAGLREKLGIR